MGKYLRKKRLYELFQKLLPEIKFPKIQECDYKAWHGEESLRFTLGKQNYEIKSLYEGLWILVTWENSKLYRKRKDGGYEET